MGRQDPFWQSHNYNDFPNNGDLGMPDQNGNYRHPEIRGWRKVKHVLFKGVGGEKIPYVYPVAAQLGADLNPGIGITFVYDENYPAIWISGAGEIAFEDLIIRNRKVGINLGVMRRGINHIGNDDASYCIFRNVSVDVVSSSWLVSAEDKRGIIENMRRVHPELASIPDSSPQLEPHIVRHIWERVGVVQHRN